MLIQVTIYVLIHTLSLARNYLKEKLDSGLVGTPYVSKESQLADVLAKGLLESAFKKIFCKLGMANIYSVA